MRILGSQHSYVVHPIVAIHLTILTAKALAFVCLTERFYAFLSIELFRRAGVAV